MIENFVGRCTVLFLISVCIAVTLQVQDDQGSNRNYAISQTKQAELSDEELQRDKRLLFKKPSKPGIFRIIGGALYEQVNETASAYRQISSMIRENFADSNEPAPTSPPSTDPNATTTPAPYRITREDFFALIRRNLRGLVKLFRFELKDALNQSSYSISDYRQQFQNEIGRIVG